MRKTVSKAARESGGARVLAKRLGVADVRTVQSWIEGARKPQQRYWRDIKTIAGEDITWRDAPRDEISRDLGVSPKTVAIWQRDVREMPSCYREALESGSSTLRGWRRAHGMTRADVAAMTGVHPDTVTRWEQRNAKVSADNHRKLIDMAGAVAVEWWPLSDTEKLRRLNGWTIEDTAQQLGVSRKKAAGWASKGGEPEWVRREILNLRSGLPAGVPSILRRGRRSLGLSVKDISESLGVSLATVRSWERGEDTPHRNRLSEVAEVYGVREADLQKRATVVRGSSIKKWRESLCITQREAAERLGVSFATVSRWESGRGRPGPESMEKLVSMGWSGF